MIVPNSDKVVNSHNIAFFCRTLILYQYADFPSQKTASLYFMKWQDLARVTCRSNQSEAYIFWKIWGHNGIAVTLFQPLYIFEIGHLQGF